MSGVWTRMHMVAWLGIIAYMDRTDQMDGKWDPWSPNPVRGVRDKPREAVKNGPKRTYSYPDEPL